MTDTTPRDQLAKIIRPLIGHLVPDVAEARAQSVDLAAAIIAEGWQPPARVMKLDEWSVLVADEFTRQRLTYTIEHDRNLGAVPLLSLIIDYCRRGETVKAAALAHAVADVAAGWRSPVRTVSTAEQAKALRDGTLVVTRMGGSGYVWRRHVHATFPALYALEWAIEHYGPLTVVWEPEEGE